MPFHTPSIRVSWVGLTTLDLILMVEHSTKADHKIELWGIFFDTLFRLLNPRNWEMT